METPSDDRKTLLNEWERSFNDRDWDAHCALYAADVIFTVLPSWTVLGGHAEVRNALESFTAKYPDIQLTVKRNSTEGDLTAVEWDEIGSEAIFNFCGMIAFKDGLISTVTRFGVKQP